MSVRAKFQLNSITSQVQYVQEDTGDRDERGQIIYRGVYKEVRSLVFNPVYGKGDPNHENTKFWQASPSGKLELNVINPQAWSQFELNKEYYLDFTPAD